MSAAANGYRYEDYHPDQRNRDPLTDSAAHRLGLGTMVRLHLYKEYVDCGLLAIRDVTTWYDLISRVANNAAIEVMAPRRRVFSGGVILWAEVLSDALEDEPVG